MNILLITPKKEDLLEIQGFIQELQRDDTVRHIKPDDFGEAIQLLSENKTDITLFATGTKSMDYLSMAEELIKRFPRIPFVSLCDVQEQDTALQVVRIGMQDYLFRGEATAPAFEKILVTSIARENLRNQLDKARKEAEEALAYKDRMLSRMSHQIRTPLNAITGVSELLEETELNSKQAYYNQLIREHGNKLVVLINDLNDYSRIEAGHIKIHQKPFNIYDSMLECIQTVLPDAINRKLELVWHMSPQCPETIIGDDLRIRQLVINLLENAIKFTKSGYVELFVGVCESESKMICFRVTDSGKGIEKEMIPTLFKAYTKLDENNSTEGGVGLGLAICRNLVELMDGAIMVESTPGSGSVFTIKLPLKTDEDLSESIVTQGNFQLTKNTKVLYLSSSKLLDKMLKNWFSVWGIHLDINEVKDEMPLSANLLEGYDLLITNVRDNIKLDLKLIDRVRAIRKMPHLLFKYPESSGDRLTVVRKDTVILLKPLEISLLKNAVSLVLKGEANSLHAMQTHITADERLGEHHPLDILVAEDNAINQKIIQGILNRYSYQPKLVENGLLALESIRKRTYDVVLMDVQMPEMDGLEATKHIRAELPEKRQPFIVALTADALHKSKKEYLDAGMDEVLYKPVQINRLIELLANTKRIER